MQSTDNNTTPHEVTAGIRRNTWSAAVAAILLIYFGFFYLAAPSGNDLFSMSALVFYHTIRIGGIAMGVVAVWSWLGHRLALAVDGIVSVGIGVLLIVTGLGMLGGGGDAFQTVLYVLFGGMFISAGVRNWRHYLLLAPPGAPGSITLNDESGYRED